MKKHCFLFFLIGAAAGGWAAETKTEGNPSGKPKTVRQEAQYLTTDPDAVEDTCPGHDILKRFTCTKDQPDGYKCFDVSIVQGDPIPSQRYDLLDEELTPENVSPDPQCLFTDRTCEAFLKNLNYNLDFSWFITNFPSSSFPQCAETYSCTRIACFFPPDKEKGETSAQKLSCVYKKNQLYFVGANITCQYK